jgi:3-hydroxybutyryl-CoA dehydratase
VVKTITQERLWDYAQASGDFNPLHLDANFAATTQFGGIVAHGMLTLAFISEMMATAFGRAWLENGRLQVKFKGAAYLGDRLETWGRVIKEEFLPIPSDSSPSMLEAVMQASPAQDGGVAPIHSRVVVCSVGARNQQSGQELISGTATVML